MTKRKTIPESEFVLQEGCILAKLLTLLTVAGEVPVSAIPLLGNYKSYMRVIQKARKVKNSSLTHKDFISICNIRKDFFLANEMNPKDFGLIVYKHLKKELSYYILTMESMDGVGIVVTVIYDVVIVAIDEYRVVARAMDGAIGIGLQDATLVLVGSHWPLFADGILHAVGMVVA